MPCAAIHNPNLQPLSVKSPLLHAQGHVANARNQPEVCDEKRRGRAKTGDDGSTRLLMSRGTECWLAQGMLQDDVCWASHGGDVMQAKQATLLAGETIMVQGGLRVWRRQM